MADLAVSLAKSVVEGAVTKALAAIEEEATLRQSTQNDLAFITGEFQMMQSFLNVADEERARNNVVRTWVRQVRDLAYNVEDCIEYVIHLDKASDCHCRCLPGFIRPELPLDKAVAEIKLLKGRVEEVSLRNMRYNLISDSGSKPVTQQQLVPGASVGATTFDMLVKARDTTKMQRGLGDLTKLLITKKPGGDLGVISVWAAGGNADTTPIIREAYGKPEICDSFRCRGWAKLSHPFNPHEFQRSLLIQFHTNSCLQKKSGVDVGTLKRLEVAAEGELIEEFMEQMKERYLIILENVSSMVEWDTVRAYLPEEKNHSWVIISTQQSEVARLCVGDPWQVFELKQSSAEHSVCVFFREVSSMYSWVDVSHPFNLRNLAWSLLSQLQSDSPQQNGISNPIQECHELLEKHRCLVIIDGLQSTEEWDLIRHYLVSWARRTWQQEQATRRCGRPSSSSSSC